MKSYPDLSSKDESFDSKSSSKKNLKVAFYVYPAAFQAPGGGEVQLLKTKEALEREGVEVKLFDSWTDKLKTFDLLHTFGSVKDALSMMEAAKSQGVPCALSTICWYSWQAAWHTYPSLKGRAVSLSRHFAKSFFPFLPSQRKRMMEIAKILFPNSQTEAEQLSQYFCVPKEKIFVVPNGVDPAFAFAKPEPFFQKYNLKDFILVVGRIEPRKNQLNMVRALNQIDRPAVIIGDYVPHYRDYYEACHKEAGKHIHFLGPMPHGSDLLGSAYAACDTFLLASWLETPGLAALEAGLAGAKIVLTSQGATREYFQDHVLYTSPANILDIAAKIKESLKRPKKEALASHIRDHFQWKHVAQKTLEGYLKISRP